MRASIMIQQATTLLAGIIFLLSFSSKSFADLRDVDVWRSSESPGHYFVRDYGQNVWVENINCQAAFTFKPTQIKNGEVQLYDETRKMSVSLTSAGMYIWSAANSTWSLYRSGKFDPRYVYYHVDATGSVHNFINLKNNCTWVETTGFTFRETSVDAGSITMYDHSRNLYMRLTNERVFLREGNVGGFNFFHTGHW